MSVLIDTQAIVSDTWTYFDGSADAVPVGGDCLLPLEPWIEHPVLWQEHADGLGIILGATDDPARIAPQIDALKLIAIQFDKFTDGRGFSTARLLRQRFGFTGTLRAIGEVIPDQVPLMARCGFTEFVLADETAANTALRLMGNPLPAYQTAATNPELIPLPGSDNRRAGERKLAA